MVYHNVQKELKEQGVIYVDFETAVKEYEDLIKPYFGQLITPRYHKFAALHYAVWSGGSFVYVPKGVHVRMPLQSYFRLNAPGAGQFEHTLIIVEEGADCHFIEAVRRHGIMWPIFMQERWSFREERGQSSLFDN